MAENRLISAKIIEISINLLKCITSLLIQIKMETAKLFDSLAQKPNFEESSDELTKQYQMLKKYSDFNIHDALVQYQSKLYDCLYENVRLSRAMCLMRLSQMEDFEFFDSPTLEEMFDCAIAIPSKIMRHFNTLISQALISVINDIYKNYKSFADNIIKHFQNDISLHPLFGLSTFPSIYGFFTTTKQCKYGHDIICYFLEKPEMIYLVESMLSSYFYCAHPFNILLWKSFHHFLISQDKMLKMTADNFLSYLRKSIEIASHHLTKYHISIIQKLFNLSPALCTKVIVSHFKYTFDSFYSSGEYFIHSRTQELAGQFFDGLQINQIIDCFKNGGTALTHPQQPTHKELIKTPLIFSDRDVVVLLEILKEGNEVSQPLEDLLLASEKLFQNSYTPFSFDFYPLNYQPPKSVKFPVDHITSRKWKQIKTYSIEHGISPITILHKNHSNDNLLKLGLASEILEMTNNIEILELFITIQMRLKNIIDFQSFLKKDFSSAVTKYIEAVLKEMKISKVISSSSSTQFWIEKTLSNLFQFTKDEESATVVESDLISRHKQCLTKTEKDLKFEIVKTALNYHKMSIDPSLKNLSLKITRALAPACAENEEFMRTRQKQVSLMMEHAINFKYSFSCSLGHQFSAMLNFMSTVNQFAEAPMENEPLKKKDLLSKWFRCGIILCSTNDVFISFFLFTKIISSYHSRLEFLDDTKKQLWISFTHEMTAFLSNYNQEVIYQLSQYKFNNKQRKRSGTLEL